MTDYALYFSMRDNFRFGGNLAALDGAGVAGQDGVNALTFVQNHDVGPPVNRLLAYAFIAAYPGYPAFFDVDLHDGRFSNLVWVQNNLAAGAYVNRYNDQDTIIFTRGDKLLAAISQRADGVTHRVATPWRNTRIHDYTGHAQDLWTNDAGWVDLWIPPQSYVMMAVTVACASRNRPSNGVASASKSGFKSERFRCLAAADPYTGDDRFAQFVARVEGILSAENTRWIEHMSGNAAADKAVADLAVPDLPQPSTANQ